MAFIREGRTVQTKKVVVGITGASGAPYAKRLLNVLGLHRTELLEVAVCISSTAPEVWALECGGDIRREVGFPVYEGRDYGAPFASGSAGWDAMVIVPCSMSTVARVASGVSDTLLTRAADVMLKERRKLIVVPRESPLSVIHLENLLKIAKAGALVLPAMPSYYGKPTAIADLVDSVVGRVLDHLDFGIDLSPRWGQSPAHEERP